MKLNIDIPMPHETERQLRSTPLDLEVIAKESFLVELYRRRQLKHTDLAALLGLDRWETDRVLRRYSVEDLSPADLEQDLENIRRMTNG